MVHNTIVCREFLSLFGSSTTTAGVDISCKPDLSIYRDVLFGSSGSRMETPDLNLGET